MSDGSKSLEQSIQDARKVLNARLARKRKLDDRGRYITASLVLRVADDDPALARRIREIVSRGVKNDRDHAAVASTLERLAEAEQKSQQAPGTEPDPEAQPRPAGEGHDRHAADGHDPHRAHYYEGRDRDDGHRPYG